MPTSPAFALLIAVLVCARSEAATGTSGATALAGFPMEPIGENLFVEPGAPPADRAWLRLLYARAVERLVAFYGAQQAPVPSVALCESEACRARLAGDSGAIVAVRKDAAEENVLTRALAANEVRFRARPGRVPPWFSEGLATYVGHEPSCPKERVAVGRGEEWRMWTDAPGAVGPTPCRARLELATWLERKGQSGLRDLLAGLRAGKPFQEAYAPTAPKTPPPPPRVTGTSLAKEAINGVVRAHLAGVKYCYEKELADAGSPLSGGVDVRWVVAPSGQVTVAEVLASSTLDSESVRACIVRQIRHWTFPSAATETEVGRYPFFFKGGESPSKK